MPWKTLDKIAPDTLLHAREQLHQAVQLVGLIGRSFLPPDAGDACANLEWINKHQALAGRWVGKTYKYRAALQFATLSLLVLNQHDAVLASLPLDEKKYQKAFTWLQHTFAELGFDTHKLSLHLPYEIPRYPMAQHLPFSIKEEKGMEELARYFANADGVLQWIKQQTAKASDVRCWPHHFDIVTLITLEAQEDGGQTKSIGIGFSPGDESIGQPYFYVNSWPYPKVENSELSDLPGGHWHTDGWTGTVLLASEIIHSDDQQVIAARYIEASTRHLQSLMGYPYPLISLTF